MKRILIAALILGFAVLSSNIGCASDTQVEAEESADGFQAVEEAEFEFAWKAEGDELTIRFGAETENWVAVGFNPTRMMKDANIIMAYVNDEEEFVTDHYGTGWFSHKADEELGGSMDVSLLSAEKADGWSRFEISIALDSGDEYDTPLSAGETVEVIMAYGRNEDISRKHKAHIEFEIEL